MSKLQELINRLCPNGVEFKPLGELGTFIRGNGLQKKDFTESGVGCIHYGQIYTHYGTFASETKSFVSPALASKLLSIEPGNLVIACTSENVEDVGKAVAWLGKENIVTGGHSVVFKHNLNPKYVAYFFQTDCFFKQKKRYAYGAKVIDIKTEDLAKIIIPIPPLEVQEEIVKILDRFADYSAELQAELQARKEQYEYYRNLLLTFNPSASGCGTDDEQEDNVTTWGGHSYPIVWKTMGEIFDMKAGKAISADLISDTKAIELYPCYGANGLRGYVPFTNQLGPMVLIGRQGALCGNVAYANGAFYATDHAVMVKDKGANHPKYIYHILTHANLNQYKTAGAQPGLSVARLEKVVIPVPPLELQEKIVAILDRFEALVNDLSQGLPAEIAAVKEQYEYYRNRLLTFKKLA